MFSFALSIIRIVGITLITAYVGVGMVLGPITHIRGYPDPRTELACVRNRRIGIEREISDIQQTRVVITLIIAYNYRWHNSVWR